MGEFFTAIDGARPGERVAWALDRFEMGCERHAEAQALSDYLLALRALLDGRAAGQASFRCGWRRSAQRSIRRHEVQRRLEEAVVLERFVMGGATSVQLDAESPRELVAEAEATSAPCCATCSAATSTPTSRRGR